MLLTIRRNPSLQSFLRPDSRRLGPCHSRWNGCLARRKHFWGNDIAGLGILTIPFSIVAIVGAVNAYNMIDGHDGLAGFSFIVSLLAFLLLLFYRATDTDLQYIVLVILLIVLMLVFIPFNIGLLGSRRKIFLGDAGSMLCGLVMVFF